MTTTVKFPTPKYAQPWMRMNITPGDFNHVLVYIGDPRTADQFHQLMKYERVVANPGVPCIIRTKYAFVTCTWDDARDDIIYSDVPDPAEWREVAHQFVPNEVTQALIFLLPPLLEELERSGLE